MPEREKSRRGARIRKFEDLEEEIDEIQEKLDEVMEMLERIDEREEEEEDTLTKLLNHPVAQAVGAKLQQPGGFDEILSLAVAKVKSALAPSK